MLAANKEATAGAVAVFNQAQQANYEIYAEYRDDQRFPGAADDDAFAEEMKRKYGGKVFDAILAFGESALQYTLDHRPDLRTDAPVVFGGIGDGVLAGLDLPADAYGVRSRYALEGTLALAQGLQPKAGRVVVLSGSSTFDESWRNSAKDMLAQTQGIEVEYLSGLTIEGFQQAVAGLDPSAILILLTVFKDAAGQHFTPLNAAELIAARSGAPSYTVYDTFIGHGVVGGEVQRFSDMGSAMAEQALKLASGENGIERLREVPARPVVDWRQMKRFGLDPNRLPPDAEIGFRDPSPWERYRVQILLASAVVLTQSATIIALVVQDRRRRNAKREADARQAELAHMSRVAQLGELSGALAHELNQPLTSILANAEAGARIMGREPVDLPEIAAILADIAEDDRRAADIIVDLRRLMAKAEPEFHALDLNDVVEATVRLTKSEFLVRQVTVQMRLTPGKISLRANRGQIKQVLLNLLINAADAMADQPPSTRIITVGTRRRTDGWCELCVHDRGPGLASSVAADPFRPFVTTKQDGLGLGLSICRTIVDAHEGTLAFDPDAPGGTRAVLALPPS